MTSRPRAWQPTFSLTPRVARALMAIEAAKAVVAHSAFPPDVAEGLRHQARLRSTHYSTRIEGNRLTLAETAQVVDESKTRFHGRERDVKEVKNYWNALLKVEQWAADEVELTEKLVQKLHALVEHGPRARPTPYRSGQNVIRDSSSGHIVYMPPTARDVPGLMASWILWIQRALRERLPPPLIAGLAHYQFVTIHPYYDGNGRTARLLATLLLHRTGYDLNGFFSLEEHHAKDLQRYYQTLAIHPHHNYYEGRDNADLTPWIEYFAELLADVFEAAKDVALREASLGSRPEPLLLRKLDRRARVVLRLFAKSDRLTTAGVARALGLSNRMARVLLQSWVEEEFLIVLEPSRRSRAYGLSAIYRQFIGN